MEKMKTIAISAVVALLLFIFLAGVSASKNNAEENKNDVPESKSKHFVLVHGSCFGGWSWFKIVPLLESAGHKVTAIDLAAAGINLLHATDVHSFSEYAKPLMLLMESIPSDPMHRVILVGHSSGGAVISQAMEHFPDKVSVGVFLTAGMPGPSLNYSDIAKKAMTGVAHALDNKFTYDNGPNNPPTTFIFGPMFLAQVVFQFSPSEDVALATALVRPRGVVKIDGLGLSEAKYGSVSRVYIISERDKILTKEIVDLMLKKNPPNRVFKITNSDHMAMVSQPTQLLAHLLTIVQDYS